jgi:hypothetical protein
MRDVVTGFYVDVLNRLIANGSASISDSVLVVCGGPLDENVMRQVGFSDFTITNLDGGMANHRQDAENLTYDDDSFDLVIVHAGHRAELRRCAISSKPTLL